MQCRPQIVTNVMEIWRGFNTKGLNEGHLVDKSKLEKIKQWFALAWCWGWHVKTPHKDGGHTVWTCEKCNRKWYM